MPLSKTKVAYPFEFNISAIVAALLVICPSMFGNPVLKLDTDLIPTACCDLPVSNDALVGEHRGVT